MIKAIIFDFYGVLNQGMEGNHQVLELIKNQLKPKYKIGLVSNADDEFMYEIIPESELQKLFDDIIVSYKVGVAKPDPKIFEMSLKNLGVKVKEAVFIDDIDRFCVSAKTLGITTICYTDYEQMETELNSILTAGRMER